MTACFFLNLPLSSSSSTAFASHKNYQSPASFPPLLTLIPTQLSHLRTPRFSRQIRAASAAMEATQQGETTDSASPMKLLFVEMGVGYDQHGSACFRPFDSLISLCLDWLFAHLTILCVQVSNFELF